MKLSLQGLLADVPVRNGNGGKLLTPSVFAPKSSEPVTRLDITTTNAKRILEKEAEQRATKTALLRAAREKLRGGEGR